MNCENCYYQKLCERDGVSFKAEADGVTCAQLKNYPAVEDIVAEDWKVVDEG